MAEGPPPCSKSNLNMLQTVGTVTKTEKYGKIKEVLMFFFPDEKIVSREEMEPKCACAGPGD